MTKVPDIADTIDDYMRDAGAKLFQVKGRGWDQVIVWAFTYNLVNIFIYFPDYQVV